MKHRLLLFLVLLLVLSIAAGLGESSAPYTARTSTMFSLHATPDGQKLIFVPKGAQIGILEWTDKWCLAEYNGTTGYCKTSWLYSLCPVDPFTALSPQNPHQPSGYIVPIQDLVIKTISYDGTLVPSGDLICAIDSRNGFYEIPVWRDKLVLSDPDTEYHAFAPWYSANPGEIISGFTTFYSDRQGKAHPREREYNMQLGCSRINGHTLAPGETFSFNALCGPYRKSNNYRLAPNISQDGEGYGGGVCQVSTTLYNALLPIPLQLEFWSIHRPKGVPYVAQYFDAAVGTRTDLVFTNTLPYSITIRASAKNGIVSIFIVRTPEE